MSIEEKIDQFLVIHAPFACPERKILFEAELKRVGISNYKIVNANKIFDNDDRLREFAPKSNSSVSLIDAAKQCIELAQMNKWKIIAIIEDDIVFRKNFKDLWREVEEDFSEVKFDLLTLHRRAANGRFITIESFLSKVKLVKYPQNMGT